MCQITRPDTEYLGTSITYGIFLNAHGMSGLVTRHHFILVV